MNHLSYHKQTNYRWQLEDLLEELSPPHRTLVSFTPREETMQNAKNSKKIVRLTLIDALMCPKI